jgi:hypothetical protein
MFGISCGSTHHVACPAHCPHCPLTLSHCPAHTAPQVGSLVSLVMSDVAGMLHTDMNFRTAKAGCQATCWTTPRAFRFHSRVAAVEPGGGAVTLERALPVNVSTAWEPELWSYAPGVSEVGIEDMRVEHK